MYAIQTTPGFIVDSRPKGEAGKLLSIFTRDLGLVAASAQGIRLEKSKLRYHTQDHSFGIYSLVRGKESWRLTSASGQPRLAEDRAAKELVARIALLLRRFLQGEEPHPELYARIEACAGFLDAHPRIDGAARAALESLTVFRVLHALGYVGSDPALDGFLSPEITDGILARASAEKKAINLHINRALSESHL